ncbi:hypothetical protein M011DRAFT_468860 [Sporormia fimetaria CBS 119925]|uniref:DRBM domain-containing protein n=1 Tax=Sporormia fimetaria CBS 119925 TaxID=1340428 RepID=A0A6A6V9L0_9PLEO|nr:hypothetical protein M011DRAFT_468860 [Sporormia fimetaria CBS 119925]
MTEATDQAPIYVGNKWRDLLKAHCAVRGLPEPRLQDVSDRRGGRTAWTCRAEFNGTVINALYHYELQRLEQAREDAAEQAVRYLTGTDISRGEPPSPSAYRAN